ncbi:MAG: hypothetical protein P8N09_02605 [Planctomycetota bacterium]|nr:hypothetical protein [Planctomycetota bacterium]
MVAFQANVDLADKQLISFVKVSLGDRPAVKLDECARAGLESQGGVVSRQQSCVLGFYRGISEAGAGRGIGPKGGR